ncbi:MAG TPA: S53 family peptidase [Bryobacteraceae bacterium]|nr:S53 family peptidase [Bryobacteraceae bacterium]
MADKKKHQNTHIPDDYIALEGSDRAPAKGAARVAPADPNEKVTVRIYVRRRPDGPPLPDHAYWAKTPPGQRTYVPKDQFAQLYGASPEDLNKVHTFAASHGLTVVETNAESRHVLLSGTVAQMNEAFKVDLGRYESPNQKYRGREGQIHIPRALQPIVQSVLGLDNRRVARHHGVGGPPGAVALTPLQVATAYNFPASLDATGQTVGIIELDGGYGSGDIKAFLSTLGLPLPTITPVPVTQNNTPLGSLTNPLTADLEVTLDIDVVAAIAQNADILVYFGDPSDAGFNAAMSAAINPGAGDPPSPSVISCSWGGAEVGWTGMAATTMNQTIADAAAKGITVFVASGDEGSDCEVFDGSAHVIYPASDPGVTGCGGTFTVLSPFSQGTWNDGGPQPPNDQPAGATGGGVSTLVFPPQPALPLWQQNANVPKSVNDGSVGRGVPDVSGQASGYSGYVLTMYGKLTTAITNPDTGMPIGPIGGTSEVAPLYAGLTAVINANLNQQVGFLNPSLYAFAEQPGFTPVFTDINDGVSNQWSPGAADAAHSYKSGPGWDACTGLGVIDGSALLSNLQTLFQKSMTFIMQRDTFGKDEVTSNGVFLQAFFVTVAGLRPSDFPGGGITTLSATQAQLNAWAPSIPDPTGPAGPTNITITPSAVSSDDPSLSDEVQLFTFTYTVTFPDLTAFTVPPAADFPETLILTASLPASTGVPPASQPIELILAADPYFSSESNGGLYWLSEDIRVFYAEQGSTLFGAPALGSTPADAISFIQWIINNISGPAGTGPNGDTFEDLPTAEGSALLSLLPTATNPPHKAIFNFALARVRLTGESEKAKVVRAFFRLFQSQSVAVPYQSPVNNTGVSAPTGAYRQFSDGTTDGFKTPLLGISADGSEYTTVPCFATARQPNTTAANNMTTQPDPPNVQPMTPIPGQTVYAYFGCWLDNNQNAQIFPFAPGANPDGPFSGSLNTLSQVLDRGGHQCIIVEIVDDDAPILNNTTPGADKIAQRNLAFTTVANPGLTDSRLATHTFEIRPSPFTLNSDERPDELMIDWGNVPAGSVASIYLPAVDAAGVLSLADRMYTVHNLTAADAHTLQCNTGGTTYIPIPQGSGPNYAGLFSVQLPLGIRHGQEFRIVVRQITSSFENQKGAGANPAPVPNAVSTRAELRVRERFVYGSFQINIPVSVKSDMLIPEERNLSFFRWIQETIPATSRWYPVFQRYIAQLVGKVTALGGDGPSVPPSQTGSWPGLPGFGTGSGTGKGPGHGHEPCPGHGRHECHSYTGKIDGIIYDHFGDFEAFILETFEGERRRFVSHEVPLLKIVNRAWTGRILTTVLVHRDRPERPLEIILKGAPLLLEE